ncbi:MAG TPA: diguanylate cyclase [Thiobacillus sp.]|nr:diguanylate cyclase [Thiobacillus sp.]
MAIPNYAQNHKPADLTELVGTQLFKQVSMAQVAALLRYCPTLTLTDGDRLIVPGQTVDKVHLLLQGRLQVFEDEPNGKPIGHILQGECVGLSSFVDRQPCHVSIVSEGICRLLVLDEERLTALTNTPTAVSRNLLLMLMNYLRNKAARAPEPAAAPVPNNHIDALTGLHNQRWLDETLDRLILRAATDRAPLSLIAVDLLDLAGLTEQYGQEILDMSVCEFAKTLSSSLRPTDLIARHATGRFVIMLPGANQENTDMVSARIQEIVNSTKVVISEVCTLPPMKIVMGASTMSAFVSGRKLVGDAFAALEQNRASLLAVVAEPPTEITIDVDLESPAADVSAIPPLETQPVEATDSMVPALSVAESLPTPPDETAAEMAVVTLSEGAFCVIPTPQATPAIQAEDKIVDSSTVTPEERPDDPSHLAA